MRDSWFEFVTIGNLRIVLEGVYRIYLNEIKEKIERCQHVAVGFGNTRIATDYAQNPPWNLPEGFC